MNGISVYSWPRRARADCLARGLPGDQATPDQESASGKITQAETPVPGLCAGQHLHRNLSCKSLSGRGGHFQVFLIMESLFNIIFVFSIWLPFSLYHLNGFELLMLKYVLGYSDLIFVPLLIIVMDPDVRGGVCEVCRWLGIIRGRTCYRLYFRNKRAAREPAESSIF